MATVTLRPTSASGTSWSNTAYVYDGSTTTAGTVSISSSNYSSRTLTCNFDTSSIPSGATINSATLTIIAKQSSSTSSRRITVRCAVNGGTTYAINTQLTSTSNTTLTANIASSMSSLSTIVVTGYMTSSTSSTFSVYELYIDVDYTVATATSNIYVGDIKIGNLFLGDTRISKAYLGEFLLYSYGSSEGGGEEEEGSEFSGALVFTSGKNIDDDGNVVDDSHSTYYVTVDAMQVIGGHSYTITINPTNVIGLNEYNSSMSSIDAITLYEGSSGSQTVTYTASSNCAYIRLFSYSSSAPTGTMTPNS